MTGEAKRGARLDDLTTEAVLGITLAIMKGKVPARWMCMSDKAKAEYAQIGMAAVAAFKEDEIAFKKARDEGNPRGFFCAFR